MRLELFTMCGIILMSYQLALLKGNFPRSTQSYCLLVFGKCFVVDFDSPAGVLL